MSAFPRLNHLLSRLSDGLLEPAEAEEMNEILRGDPAARERYLIHIAMQMALEDQESEQRMLTFPVRRARRWPWLAAAAAAAVMISAVTWLSWPSAPKPGHEQQTVTREAVPLPPVVAITMAAEGVEWSLPEAAASGRGVPVGPVRTSAGDLTISVTDGPEITFRGPAEFRLESRSEIRVVRGKAAFRSSGRHRPFLVRVEHGYVIDSGGEFSVIADEGGDARFRAFAGQVRVSTVGAPGGTLEEWDLKPDSGTLLTSKAFQLIDEPDAGFPRVPAEILPGPAIQSDAYPQAVRESLPVAYWRFERLGAGRGVADEMAGEHMLELRDQARLEGTSQRYLYVNGTDAAGFAVGSSGIEGLDSSRGRSVECFLYATGKRISSAVALQLDGPIPEEIRRHHVSNHAPHAFLLEAAGRGDEDVRYHYPDFAMRALGRSPVGYAGGYDLFSREGNLLYRWMHVVATFGPEEMCLYIDGELSQRIPSPLPGRNVVLRATVGRLQPGSVDEFRQWSGGIDELALYGRPLSAAEVRAHYQVSGR